MNFRGYDIEYLVSCLLHIEDNLSVSLPERNSSATFRRINDWLVSDAYLRVFIARTLFRINSKRIPMFCLASNLRGIVKGLLLLSSKEKIKAPIKAQAILVKNNVRAFYPNAPLPFSIKILISKIRNTENMKNEISIRKDIERQNFFNVPKILDFDLSFDPAFFCEEIIWGERAFSEIDDRVITEILSPELWRYYERNGIEFKPLQEVQDWRSFRNDFFTSIKQIPWESNYGDKESFLFNVERQTRRCDCVLYGQGHGDLCPGNLIITLENDVYLIDWEQAGQKPLVFDLYEILTEFQSSMQYFKNVILEIAAKKNNTRMIPFNQQVCLAAFLRISQWCGIFPGAGPRKISGLKRRLSKAITLVNELSLE